MPFLHIESIAARSRPRHWEIVPHRHDNLAHFLVIKSKGGYFRIDAATHRFQAPAFIGVPSKLVHGFEFEPETEGIVLTMSEKLVSAATSNLSEPDMKYALTQPLLVDLAEGIETIDVALRQIEHEIRLSRLGQLSAIVANITLIFVTAVRQRQPVAEIDADFSADLLMVTQLRRLIEDQLDKHRSINDFADTLGVTGARLNNACRRVTSCSILQLVHAAMLLEAKRNLIYTSMKMSEIGYALGFVDPAYFSRFFTRHEGLSPLNFRKRHTEFERALG